MYNIAEIGLQSTFSIKVYFKVKKFLKEDRGRFNERLKKNLGRLKRIFKTLLHYILYKGIVLPYGNNVQKLKQILNDNDLLID